MRDATTFWDREMAAPTHVSWMENAAVRRYVNRSMTGSETQSAVEWFHERFPKPFARGLSIGCGSGGLERDLIRRGVCMRIDAFDGSIASLAIAQQEAIRSGLGSAIRYFAADFNNPVLPPVTYDVVFVHQALHHVAELERLYASILQSLKPGGVFYFDEYIGPSRFDWNDRLIRPHREVYDALPAEVRNQDKLLFPIQPDDPSEAYRSSEIVDLVPIGFDVVEHLDYGGNLLSVLFPAIDWNRADAGLVDGLIEREEKLLANGARPYHTVVIAHAKAGAAREAAVRRYARAAVRNRARHKALLATRAAQHFARRVRATLARRLGVAASWLRR
jgi:SAM-dependent methyltransferase